MTAFEQGAQAKRDGKSITDLPVDYIARFTLLGTPVPNEQGEEWLTGWYSVPRIATKAEVEAATRLTDVGQFRSRHRRDR